LFRADEYICSACGSSCDKPYKVCPKCAAKMKKGKYDPSWVDEAEGLSALLDDDW
jgi:predicted amidophosphoribosyltransferase